MQKKSARKIECVNPNTGRKMKIDAATYNFFSDAIYHSLQENKQGISFTELVNGIKKYFKKQKTEFKGSVGWCAITVKNDLEVSGAITFSIEKGKNFIG
jgi:hypothetical protein